MTASFSSPLAHPTLSACLIVKNEARNLGRCLDSLKGVVDEIVVVDTGSTDETVAIAESYGAKLGHFAWVDDFSAARNASLELATGDWVLVIDADEELVVQDLAALHALMRDARQTAFAIRLANLDDKDIPQDNVQVLRLFPRAPGVRFSGRLHEAIDRSLEQLGGWRVEETAAIRLLHRGYQTEAVKEKGKPERNLRLAQRDAEEHPESSYAWFNLCRSFIYADQLTEALRAYHHLLGIKARGQGDTFVDRYLKMADQQCQASLVKIPDAEAQLREAMELLPEDFEPVHRLMGIYRAQHQDVAGALPYLTRAVALDPTLAETYYWLGYCAVQQERFEEAWTYWERCLELQPDHDAARQGVAVLNRSRPALMGASTPVAASAPLISACLIVKNEAKHLGRCLDSLKGVVDEIVVVDTGSTDETVAIAESYGAKLGHFAWVDDFSAARNASLELATGDWVLVIDADEELVVSDREAFYRELTGGARAFVMTYDNIGADGRVASRYVVSPRLFRRYPGVKFSGRLHEDIRPFLKQVGWEPAYLQTAHLRHHGYTPEVLAEKDKLARNFQLAQRMTEEQPKEPTPWYFLASAAWLMKDLNAAQQGLDQLRRLRDYGREVEPTLRPAVALLQAQVSEAAGRPEDAMGSLEDGLARFPGHPELHYERGKRRLEAGDTAGARADFEACLKAGPAASWTNVRTGVTGYLVHMELGSMDLEAGRSEDAYAHFAAAAVDPACPAEEAGRLRALVAATQSAPTVEREAPTVEAPATLDPVADRVAAGDFDGAIDLLLAYLQANPRSAAGFLALAKVHHALENFDKALLSVGESLKLDAGSAASYHLLGLVLEKLGQPGYAEKAFVAVLSLDPDHPSARESRLAVRGRKPEFELPPEQAQAIEGLLRLVNPTVSACLIVKNEAKHLGRCLDSLKGVVDEIVVVDTGSTDETVAIAESYGAKLGHFAWVDDFSAARNASLELATGDWVLVIDADETLVVADHEALSRALRDRQNAGYILYQNHVDREGRTEAATLALRLFQRHAHVRFAGRIHETVNLATAALGWPTPVVEFISLSHIGHWDEFVTEKGKPARNVAIAELEAQDHPEEPSVWVNLARSYAMNGQWQEALATFERVAAMPGGETGLADLFWTYYVQSFKDVYVHLERFTEAEALLDRALERLPGFPDFLFERSKLRFHRGDVEGAIADLEACLAAHRRPFTLKIQEGATDVRPRQALAEIAAMRPEWKTRVETVLHGEQAPPPAAHSPVAAAVSRREDLLRHLGEQPRDASGFLELGLLFYQDGHFDKALLSVGESLKLDAGSAASYHLLGLVLEKLGQPGYAEKAFVAVLSLDPDHPSARESRLAVRGRKPEFELPPEQAQAIEGLLRLVNPTVSACLIVKNEAKHLGRCLDSLKGVVDEIVVVDTGSTDETVAIAESYGAKLGHFAWVDDFSAARNASLELATGDWVLVIDADEELVVSDHEAFRRALRDRRPAGYVTTLMNVNDEGQEETGAPMMRLFQRHPRIRFSGRLHEQLGPALDALGWPVTELGVMRLRHYGYQTEMIVSRGKAERNIKLSLAQTQDQPDDPYAWLHLARSYRLNQQLPEALAAYEQVQRLSTGDRALVDFVYATYVTGLQEVFQQMGRLQDAAQLLTEGLARLPGFPEFHFERGRVRFRLGDAAGARSDFEACLAAEGRSFHAVMREGITTTLPRQALAELALASQAQAPRLSACLIVKNEAKHLGRCLDSLKGIVDEIVVVDTGSTDETVAIAESYGAKLGHFAWVDDFSAARNASLELATGDWVLVIDADEELAMSDYEAMRTALLDPGVGGYVVDQLNLDDHGRYEANPVTRLFRRRPEVRYAGRLHEDVTVSILRLGFEVRPLGAIALRHAGYTREAVEAGGKWERNLRLSLLEVEQNGESPDAWYNLGRSTLFLAQPDRALEAFGQVLRLLEGGGVMAEGRFVNFVLLYQRLLAEHGQAEEALRVLEIGLAWLPGHAEFLAAKDRLLASR